MNRKGETLPDPNDKRSRSEKQKALKSVSKEKWYNSFWKSEARKRCEERLVHYESKGNLRKADIYRRKLGK